MKQYTSRQLNRKGRMPNYRMSRGKRVADGVIRILISSLSVLLSIMEKRPTVFRDMVLTFVVLHNILRTYKGEGGQTHDPLEDIMLAHLGAQVLIGNLKC